MNHIKDNWVDQEVFHASDLNTISSTVNEVIDAVEEIEEGFCTKEELIAESEELAAQIETKADKGHTHTPEEVGAMPADTVIIDDSTESTATTYSSSKIMEIVNDIASFDIVIVNELPATGNAHTIYFVPASEQGASQDVYDEYIYINGEWEKIGSTRIDLSNYYTKGETDVLLGEKANTNHSHEIADVTDLETTLAGKSDTGHTHSIGNVTGLQTALNAKQDTINDLEDIRSGASLGATALQSVPSEYVTESELSSELAGKSDTGHTHTMSEVSGLETELAGKSDTGHTHTMSEVNGLETALDDFSEVVSSHINEIEDTLEEKSDIGHTHDMSEISGLTEELEMFVKVVRLTQSEYDALISAGTVDMSTLYIVDPDPVPETYIATFVDWDGTELYEEELQEGEIPSYEGDTPTRPDYHDVQDDIWTEYTFSGWDNDVTQPITADTTFTAQYTSRNYTLVIKYVRETDETEISSDKEYLFVAPVIVQNYNIAYNADFNDSSKIYNTYSANVSNFTTFEELNEFTIPNGDPQPSTFIIFENSDVSEQFYMKDSSLNGYLVASSSNKFGAIYYPEDSTYGDMTEISSNGYWSCANMKITNPNTGRNVRYNTGTPRFSIYSQSSTVEDTTALFYKTIDKQYIPTRGKKSASVEEPKHVLSNIGYVVAEGPDSEDINGQENQK